MKWKQEHKRYYKYKIFEVLNSFIGDYDDDRSSDSQFKKASRSIYYEMLNKKDCNMSFRNIVSNYLIYTDSWEHYYSWDNDLKERGHYYFMIKVVMDEKEQKKWIREYYKYHYFSEDNPFKRQEQLHEKKMREDLEKYEKQKENE